MWVEMTSSDMINSESHNLQRRTWEIPETGNLQLKSLPVGTTCTFPVGNTSLLLFPPWPFWPYQCHNHHSTKSQHSSNCCSGAGGGGGANAAGLTVAPHPATCDQWQPPDLLVLQAVPDLARGRQGSSGMSSLKDLRKAGCRAFNGAEQSYSAFLSHSSRLFVT